MSPMFVPGPVDVAEEVLAAQAVAMLPHRSAEFETVFHRAEGKARRLFRTESRVFLNASSGTGMHEATVRNLVNHKMLACVNGAFSQRWYDVAKSNGKQVHTLEFDWQMPIRPETVASAVAGQGYEIVTVVHNETSTGLVNPIEEIAAVVHNVSPDTLVCVDAVSSIAGAPLEMDAWGLDLVLTSTQKCLAMPPGLALVAVNDRALAQAAKVENRGWYFDFMRLEKHRTNNSTPATPAISLIYALDVQLDRIFAEGLENRWARHSQLAARTQAWAQDAGFDLYAPRGARSQTVTTLVNDGSVDVADLNAFLLARDMRIAGGYGKIKASTFRIGHMGELTLADLEGLLAALDEYFA